LSNKINYFFGKVLLIKQEKNSAKDNLVQKLANPSLPHVVYFQLAVSWLALRIFIVGKKSPFFSPPFHVGMEGDLSPLLGHLYLV
jgi:hypothetical protein